MEKITRVALVPTKSCNLNCPFCYEKLKGPGHMPLQVAKDVFDYLEKVQGEELRIAWLGGEPFLNWGVIKAAIEYADTKNFSRIFHTPITNGTIWTDEIENFIANREDMTIKVSWHGTPEMQEKDRGCGELVDANVRRIAKVMPDKLTILMVVTPDNLANMYDAFGYMSQVVNPSKIITRPIPEAPGWTNEKLDVLSQQTYKIMKDYIGKEINLAMRGPYKRYACDTGKTGIGVGIEGNIYPCQRAYFLPDAEKLNMGNVYTGITHIPESLIEYNEKREQSTCAQCDMSSSCCQCPVLSYEMSGSFAHHDKRYCASSRAFILGTQRATLEAIKAALEDIIAKGDGIQ